MHSNCPGRPKFGSSALYGSSHAQRKLRLDPMCHHDCDERRCSVMNRAAAPTCGPAITNGSRIATLANDSGHACPYLSIAQSLSNLMTGTPGMSSSPWFRSRSPGQHVFRSAEVTFQRSKLGVTWTSRGAVGPDRLAKARLRRRPDLITVDRVTYPPGGRTYLI